jgi:hypothetical protein
MVIADHPLHGSRRAELPHRALALGHDVEALLRPGMANVRTREPAAGVAPEPHPGRQVAIATSTEGTSPVPGELAAKDQALGGNRRSRAPSQAPRRLGRTALRDRPTGVLWARDPRASPWRCCGARGALPAGFSLQESLPIIPSDGNARRWRADPLGDGRRD